jgi:predicted metal-dependent HD superfamily phosphohydrolase
VADTETQLLSKWAALVPGHPLVGAGLVRRYAAPSRRYHGLAHLTAVLEAVDALSHEAADPRLVSLAAWYHDAVYDIGSDDNEARSAALAERALTDVGVGHEQVAEVSRLVLLTATHATEAGDANGAVLCDADLAVLAGSPDEYAAYLAAVRAEYERFSDEQFRTGRTAVVEELLRLPALYSTAHGASSWEAAARANLTEELASLRR